VEQANAASADLLRLCAFLHPDAIPEDLLRVGMSQLEPPLQALGTDELAFHEAVRTLGAYSLLRRDPASQSLSLHRLVQVVLIDAMPQEPLQAWVEWTIRLLSSVRPESGRVTFPAWPAWERLLPHTLSCAAHLQQAQVMSLEAAELLRLIGWYLAERGQYSEAEPLLQQALALTEQQQGKDHMDTAFALGTLGWLYQFQGKYPEAEPLFQRALAIREQQVGPDRPDTATSLNDLALLYLDQGRYLEAEPLLQRALAIYEQQVGPTHPSTATSLNDLALLYRAQGPRDAQRAGIERNVFLSSYVHPSGCSFLTSPRGVRRDGESAEKEPAKQHEQGILPCRLTGKRETHGLRSEHIPFCQTKHRALPPHGALSRELLQGHLHPSPGITVTDVGQPFGEAPRKALCS
jgi:tetratricopeptide (TPR) repeat protein